MQVQACRSPGTKRGNSIQTDTAKINTPNEVEKFIRQKSAVSRNAKNVYEVEPKYCKILMRNNIGDEPKKQDKPKAKRTTKERQRK